MGWLRRRFPPCPAKEDLPNLTGMLRAFQAAPLPRLKASTDGADWCPVWTHRADTDTCQLGECSDSYANGRAWRLTL